MLSRSSSCRLALLRLKTSGPAPSLLRMPRAKTHRCPPSPSHAFLRLRHPTHRNNAHVCQQRVTGVRTENRAFSSSARWKEAMAEEPSVERAIALFERVESKFPSEITRPGSWYLMTLAALVGGGQPQFAPTLYSHLVKKAQYQTPEQRQLLMRRLREALLKLVSLVGVCRPLDAIFHIEAVTEPQDRDYSFSRRDWQCDESNARRGEEWLDRIYLENMGNIDERFASQKDFSWISRNITYGLYLSDRSVLDDVETEVVTLAGIMIQNLPSETHWHLRGARRIGIKQDDVEAIHQCIELVATFSGARVDRVPRVADIEHEVPGMSRISGKKYP